MKAEIIAVGSELLTPDRMDTNSLFLTEELNKLGIEVVRKSIVGDNRDYLSAAFKEALERVELIIASGGLGPTEDDLTRETVAELLGRKLHLNNEILRYIEGRFRQLGREMPAVNARQAMVPEGAEVLENARGSAPGLWLEDAGHFIALLPGPPRELKPMYQEQVLPRLQRRSSNIRMFHRELRVAGMGESGVEQRIRPIYTRYADVNTTILAAPGEIQIHLRMWTDDAVHAQKTLDEIVQGFEIALADRIFSQDGSSMEEVVAGLLTRNNSTISAAESCTGGLLSQRLTSIAGSSAYFLGGVVSYSNELKTAWADVPTAFAAKWAARWAWASLASQVQAAAARKSPWARCTSRSRTPVVSKSAAWSSRAIAKPSAGTPRNWRSIWCASISSTTAGSLPRAAPKGPDLHASVRCAGD